MKNPLSYDTRLDWGHKPLPPKVTKIYGLMVLVLTWGYLWKFHQHHASIFFQSAMAVLALGVAAMLVWGWNKPERMRAYLLRFLLINVMAQTIAVFRQ
jgi:hypothetical protein